MNYTVERMDVTQTAYGTVSSWSVVAQYQHRSEARKFADKLRDTLPASSRCEVYERSGRMAVND